MTQLRAAPSVRVTLSKQDALNYADATLASPGRYATLPTLPSLFPVAAGLPALASALKAAGALPMTGYLHAAQTVRGLLPVPAGERVAVEHESVDLVLYGMRTAAVVKGRLRSASDQVGEFETVLALPVQASSIQAKRYSPTRAPRRRELVATAHRNLPVKLATDYAAATGDWTPVHFDIAAARELGLRGVVMHGMCVLGIASETAIELVGTRDLIVRDVSARFSRPVEPGQQLSVSVYATDSRDTFAVGVASRDGAVLKDAWLTLAALRT